MWKITILRCINQLEKPDNGKIIEQGTSKEIFESPKNEQLKTFLSKESNK